MTSEPVPSGTVQRFDTSNPDDLAFVVANGLVWTAGQESQQAAVDALIAGTLPMNDRVPPQIVAAIAQARGGQ